jgi:hypothetical protein
MEQKTGRKMKNWKITLALLSICWIGSVRAETMSRIITDGSHPPVVFSLLATYMEFELDAVDMKADLNMPTNSGWTRSTEHIECGGSGSYIFSTLVNGLAPADGFGCTVSGSWEPCGEGMGEGDPISGTFNYDLVTTAEIILDPQKKMISVDESITITAYNMNSEGEAFGAPIPMKSWSVDLSGAVLSVLEDGDSIDTAPPSSPVATVWLRSPETGEAIVTASPGGSFSPVDVKIDVIKVEITSVPYNYYADSKSWVPFRFRVVTGSSTVEITGGKVEFYIGESEALFVQSLTEKPFKPTNNTAAEYLVVIDELLFDGVSTSGGVVENARFKLIGVSGTFPDGSTFSGIDSEYSSDFGFGDNTIEIIEFGEDESFDHRKTFTRQDSVDINESDSFVHMAGSRCYVGNPSGCPNEVSGADLGNLDFDKGYAGLMAGSTNTSWTQRSHLADDFDFSGVGSGQSVDARSFDRQRGVYFVAFRNIVPANAEGNPFGVPVVGTVSEHDGSVILFDEGTAKVTIKKDGLNNDHLTKAFGYSATAFGVAAFVAGPAAPVMAGASAILSGLGLITSAATAATSGSDPDIAEVVVHKVIDLANGTSRPNKSNAKNVVSEHTVGANPAVALGIGDPDFTMHTTDTYRMYLTHSTNVRALSRSVQTIDIEALLEIDLGTGEFDVAWDTIAPEDKNVIMCDL